MRESFSTWRRGRGWPTAGQIGLAIVAGLVVAVFIGVLSRHDGSKAATPPTRPSPATSTTTGHPTTNPTRVSATTSVPARQTTVARTTAPTTAPTTAAAPTPTTHLLPLVIAPPSHADTYSRAADFGDWIDIDGCRNTRATLLIRTSQVPVTFTTAAKCTVRTGKWIDPWSGAVTTVAHEFQIDHTVPLANAWRSGAWSWTHDQRVAYTNDLTDPDHLVPILASENEAKGDDGPDQWKPPATTAWCRYALDWDRIKAKWHLTATPGEWAALRQMAQAC